MDKSLARDRVAPLSPPETDNVLMSVILPQSLDNTILSCILKYLRGVFHNLAPISAVVGLFPADIYNLYNHSNANSPSEPHYDQ